MLCASVNFDLFMSGPFLGPVRTGRKGRGDPSSAQAIAALSNYFLTQAAESLNAGAECPTLKRAPLVGGNRRLG